MDIRSLWAFREIYECGSITKAAGRMYISPQGLSKNIGRLEGELGVPLFVRTRLGAVPNAHADALYPKVCDLLDTFASIHDEATGTGKRDVLRVAAVSGTLSYLGLGFSHAFETTHPDVELLIEDTTNRLVNEMMATGLADIGFMAGTVDRDRYDAVLFKSFPHTLIVSTQNPLAGKDRVSFADLTGQTVIVLGRDHPVLEGFTERLTSTGAQPAEVVGVAVLADFAHFVQLDQAVLISADFWNYANAWKGTRAIPFEDATFAWEVHLVNRRGAPLTPPAAAFKQHALEWRDVREAAKP